MSHAEMAIDMTDEREALQLMSAALEGRTEAVKELIDLGADVNARTHEYGINVCCHQYACSHGKNTLEVWGGRKRAI